MDILNKLSPGTYISIIPPEGDRITDKYKAAGKNPKELKDYVKEGLDRGKHVSCM